MSKVSVEIEISVLGKSLNDVNSSSLQISTPVEQLVADRPHLCSLDGEAVLLSPEEYLIHFPRH